jgi:hypothetical protein
MLHRKQQKILLHFTKFTLSSLQFIQSYIASAKVILQLLLAAVIKLVKKSSSVTNLFSVSPFKIKPKNGQKESPVQ